MLRGYFDGGGLRKQNGHWQSGSAGVTPPTPPAPIGLMITEGILYISGGNRIVIDGGILNPLNTSSPFSIIGHDGKPFFFPHNQSPYGAAMPSLYDPAINVAGSIYASDYEGISPSFPDGRNLQYVNTTIYRSFYKSFARNSAEVTAINDYIAQHGASNIYIKIKPNPNDPTYMRELEKNLCIGKHGEVTSEYGAVPKESSLSRRTTYSQFLFQYSWPCPVNENYITGRPSPVVLNATNGADIPANTVPIEYLHGFRIGDGIELIGYGVRNTLTYLIVDMRGSYFSFPFDYQNSTNAPYLSLKIEVYFK